jgi:hypothetical protein
MLRATLVFATLLCFATPSLAQSESVSGGSIAAESDIISFALPGYSGIVNVTLPNKLQMAVGFGRYTVPSFLLEGDANYDAAQWRATVTSLQVARATYRFRGAMHSGPAVGVVVLNQNYRLRAENIEGQTRFRTLSVGITAGYYARIGRHFYVYPTAALTHNQVQSGSSTLNGTAYKVERFSPNVSLHAGWEWGR